MPNHKNVTYTYRISSGLRWLKRDIFTQNCELRGHNIDQIEVQR